jgi:DNA-binding transcriptional LysR family regulator
MILLDVAEGGSINAAAQLRHVAQSAVSRTMRELEQALGLELLKRHARGIELTESGRALLRLARSIRAEANTASRELARLREGGNVATLVIGAHPTLAAFVLPQIISHFGKRMPDCQVTVREGMKETLLPALSAGELDLVVCRIGNTQITPDLTEEFIYQDSMVIVAGRHHPAVRSHRRIRVKELGTGRWLLPPEDSEPYSDAVKVFQALDVPIPIPKLKSDSVELIRTLLLTGQDWLAVVPRDLFWTDIEERRLRILHEVPSSGGRTIGLILRRRADGGVKSEVSLFRECLKEVVVGARSDAIIKSD